MKKKIPIFLTSFIVIFIISIFIFPVKLKQIPSSNIILDAKWIEIWEIIIDKKIRHRELEIEKIPDFTKKAIILMEDKSFYSNIWIDFNAILRSFYNNLKSSEVIEGASTISTQVIRKSYWLNEKRTYIRKIAEFYLALVLNKKYSKNEILENYLNNIYFWYLNYWIASASQYYFAKNINNLTKAEQIALLILPKNPSKFDPYKNKNLFKNRFDKIVDYLNKEWLINDNELNSIKQEMLEFNYNHKNKLPYVVDYLKNNYSLSTPFRVLPFEKGEKLRKTDNNINTSIDYNLTNKIDEIAKNTIIPLAWKDVWDYGILITDRKTNELKVMIWWVEYYSENWQVNSTTSIRQVGSTIKPFTYLLAFNDLWYKPETTILDLPVQFDTVDWNTYSPKNYSLDYKWEVTLAEALSQSINVPAIKIADSVWITRLHNFLKELNITSLNENTEHYWLALTLWVWEISLFELLQAYSIFANEWNFCDIKIIKDIDGLCKKIIDKKYVDMVYEILTNRYFKLAGFPVNSNLDFKNREVFVKTWTSRNFRDNWSIWFTKNYMIWVWVWNKDGTYMKWVSWSTWAWEIFKNIVNYLEKEDQISEKIIYNTNKQQYLKIISPLDKSTYKIDKSKPQSVQQIKLDFDTNIEYNNYKWFVNNIEFKKDFFNLEQWMFEIKLKLYNFWKIIKEDVWIIEIEW